MFDLMDLIQLKMPPDRARLMAKAIEKSAETSPDPQESKELSEIAVWLNYRVNRWYKHHPAAPAA